MENIVLWRFGNQGQRLRIARVTLTSFYQWLRYRFTWCVNREERLFHPGVKLAVYFLRRLRYGGF